MDREKAMLYGNPFNKKPLEWYKQTIREWARFDARQVVVRDDTLGKWAQIRLDILAELKNPIFYEDETLAPQLYAEYVELLNTEIKRISGNKRIYGNVPVFRYSRKARQKARKLAVTLV